MSETTDRQDAMTRHPAGSSLQGPRHPWHWADEDCACGAGRLRQDRPASVRTVLVARDEPTGASESDGGEVPGVIGPGDRDVRPRRSCGHRGCEAEGEDVLDYYGIYAGRWCADHRSEAPGQWPYDGPDTEPLDEEGDW